MIDGASFATDKGCYSLGNEQALIRMGIADIYLPRSGCALNARAERTPWSICKLLHNSRSGIEPLIGHTKQGGQIDRSRMKSDETTKSAGHTALLGFNLRQFARHISGEVHLINPSYGF